MIIIEIIIVYNYICFFKLIDSKIFSKWFCNSFIRYSLKNNFELKLFVYFF
jgi:hypothetical protein